MNAERKSGPPARRLAALTAVAAKEVRQLARDRPTFGMIVGVPLMQITLFGYAINFDVRHLATVVQDQAELLDVARVHRRSRGHAGAARRVRTRTPAPRSTR